MNAQFKPTWPIAAQAPFPSYQGRRLSEELFAAAWQATRRMERQRTIKPPPPAFKTAASIRRDIARDKNHPDKLEAFIRKNTGCTAGDIAEAFGVIIQRARERLALMTADGRIDRYREKLNGAYLYEVSK